MRIARRLLALACVLGPLAACGAIDRDYRFDGDAAAGDSGSDSSGSGEGCGNGDGGSCTLPNVPDAWPNLQDCRECLQKYCCERALCCINRRQPFEFKTCVEDCCTHACRL
jgi:hypothetical protein